MFSKHLNAEAQLLLRWTKTMGVTLLPQFIMGVKNAVADSLSRRHQVLGSEWTLAQDVVDKLRRRWPLLSIFVFQSNFLLSTILWQRGQRPFSRTGTVFRLTPFLLLLSFARSSPNYGHARAQN